MIEDNNAQIRQPDSTTAWLSESSIHFLTTYRVWILAAVWLGVRGFVLWGLSPNYFIETYFKLAGDWLDGYTPYTAFKVEFPPGALLLFTLPRFFTEIPMVYGYIFAFMMLMVDLSILLLCWRIPALVRESEHNPNRDSRYESILLCLTYILLTAVFGRLLFQNYDLLIGLLLVASIYFSLRKKRFPVDLLLAAGIWFNLTVVIWIPLLWWHGVVSRDRNSGSNKYLNFTEVTRGLLRRVAVLAVSLAILYIPFFLLSGRSLGQIVQFHFERGTQLESTAASILMLGAKIFGYELSTEFTHRAIHLSGELGSQGAAVCGILAIIVFVILTVYLARMMWVQVDGAARGVWLIRGLLATVLAQLAISKIFLPQHLLWVCPLAALFAYDRQTRISRISWRLFAVNLISVVVFFFFYPDLIEFHMLPGLLLLMRNIMVVWLVVYLLLPDSAAVQPWKPFLRITPRTRKYLLYLPVILLFSWGTIAGFRPVRNVDIWMHLRVAGDIMASGEIPRIDQYSAVALGRPHLSHEWLSAIIFLGIHKLGGGEAFSVFRASMILAMMLLLWYSVEKRARSFILTAPILALAAYVMLERVFVRPHIFTLLFACIWVFSLERWRRERRLRYLIILVPLQIFWANLHGGYIIALVFGAMMTGATALLAVFPSWSKDECYSWSDAGTFAALTGACLIASLVNPHGLRLLEFSLTLSFASDYIKQFVYEWGSPLATKYMSRAYGFDVVVSICIMMWSGLFLNLKRRPLMDACFALLATLITFQAIRFVSFIGILGFPITVRAWVAATDSHAKPLQAKRHPFIEMAIIVIIIASTLVYGFPYDKKNHRRIGWGFGGRPPIETVNFLVEQDSDGAIFNDYGDGAYILHHLAPKIRPVMDSRIDVYGRELTREYFSSRDDALKFFRYLNKYNVNLILLMQTKKNIPIIQMLSQFPASKLLLRADDRFLFSYDEALLPAAVRQRLENLE
jgi:hypothetical protein